MSDPRRYSISILENYSEKSLHEIALVVTESVFYIKPDEFILGQTKNLALGTEFLYTEEPVTWCEAEKELAPAFRDFPDTCFCLFTSDGENGGQYRTLFFNGKSVKQYPEIRYPDFHINDFEYQSSDKTPLEKIAVTVEKVEKAASEHLSKVIDALSKNAFGYASDAEKEVNEPDPVQLDFIKKSLFCDIILENAQDA